MVDQGAHKHHFVPQFLLRPWAVDGMLRGYWWDHHRGALACKRKGTKGFCWYLDLLTLQAHDLGRDALEKVFFGNIDDKGADAYIQLLASSPACLTVDQRCDFARFLLSLEARRPSSVSKLKEAHRDFANSLDHDREILAAMEGEGLTETPSSFYERESGISLEDLTLTLIQRLVDNPKIGGKLINACWHVVRLGPRDGSFVLADRPLIRIRGYDHPGAAWVLPLTPKAVLVAVNHPANLERIKQITPSQLAMRTNYSSANQAERFIFSVDTTNEHWIGRYLSTLAK